MHTRHGGAGKRDDLTQVERDCLRVASQRSLRKFRPQNRRRPPTWAVDHRGPHFFPGTIDALRRRRLLDCEEIGGESVCFASREGLQALAALPPDLPYEEIVL